MYCRAIKANCFYRCDDEIKLVLRVEKNSFLNSFTDIVEYGSEYVHIINIIHIIQYVHGKPKVKIGTNYEKIKLEDFKSEVDALFFI